MYINMFITMLVLLLDCNHAHFLNKIALKDHVPPIMGRGGCF